MQRGGRPRLIRERNASGKLRPVPIDDSLAVEIRMKRFGVTARQGKSPLSGFLAGVLFLRGQLTSNHMGRFFSFLQLVPDLGARGIMVRERVQGGRMKTPSMLTNRYRLLIKALGRDRIEILLELANDRLVCVVEVLREALGKVPLTRDGSAYMISCETYIAKIRRQSKDRLDDRPPKSSSPHRPVQSTALEKSRKDASQT